MDKTETLVSKTQRENFFMFDLKTCQQVHQYTPQSQPVLQKQSLSVPVDTKPLLESSTLPRTLHDPCYVNVIPHSRNSPNIRSHSGAPSQAVDGPCTPKPPVPTPRFEKKTDGRESEGPLIIISEENEMNPIVYLMMLMVSRLLIQRSMVQILQFRMIPISNVFTVTSNSDMERYRNTGNMLVAVQTHWSKNSLLRCYMCACAI